MDWLSPAPLVWIANGHKPVEEIVAMKAGVNISQTGANPRPAVAVRAEEVLRESKYPALWAVRCQQADGALILTGRVPLFYLKQLAQVLVAKALGGGQILNEIEVDEPIIGDDQPAAGERGQHVRHTRHSRTHSR